MDGKGRAGRHESSRALLARNMKRLREALGLSQMALAEKAGCSTTMIGNVETLKRFPSAEALDSLARALEVPVHELFMRDSPAVERAVLTTEVRDRLRERLDEVIDETLRGLGPA